MPGNDFYPFNTTDRFPIERFEHRPHTEPSGEARRSPRDASGDLRTWVIAGQLFDVGRDVYTALAYLDVADILSDRRHREVLIRLGGIADAVDALTATMAEQSRLLQQVAGFLGVSVPAWLTLKEVNEGDDMGLARPSAAELGLVVDMIPLQQEPGFGHEDVVSIDPAPGTFVARGTVVHIRVNFMG